MLTNTHTLSVTHAHTYNSHKHTWFSHLLEHRWNTKMMCRMKKCLMWEPASYIHSHTQLHCTSFIQSAILYVTFKLWDLTSRPQHACTYHGSTNTDDKFMIVRGWLTFPPQCLCAFIFISTTLWNSAAIIFHPSNIVLKALLVSWRETPQ